MASNMSSTISLPVILILRPQQYWAIVSAELRRVNTFGRYMEAKGMVRSEHLPDGSPEELRQLAALCADLQLECLYARYANKKVFRHQKDFWESDETMLRQHVKRMADQRLLQAVRVATSLDVPILYVPTEQTSLHIDDRLILDESTQVTPVMHFHRHEQGTTYQLTLKSEEGKGISDKSATAITPAEHRLVVLGHEPGLFILDNRLLLLGEGFSGKLLLPFKVKTTVEIPQHMENDYFRRFILKNVSKAEVIATGFDIEDTGLQLAPCLMVEKTFTGEHLLALHFRYGDLDYTPDSKSHGRVQLQETENGFRFIRSQRNKKAEQQALDALRRECSLSDTASSTSYTNGWLRFGTTAAMIDWLRQHGPQLRQQDIEVVQPSEHVYYIGPLSIEQSDTWNGDWLQTDVTVVLDDGRLRLPFRDLRATILRGEQDYMLPTGERLIIPQEWLQRYGDLLLTGQPSGKGFRRHRSQIENEELRMKSEEFPSGVPSAEGMAAANSCVPSLASDQRSSASLFTLHFSLKPPAALRATLRPYQQTGYEWLWNNFKAQTGCCLSDEMGLGKTVQTIALLLKYKETAKTVTSPTAVHGMLFSEEEMKGEKLSTPLPPAGGAGGGAFHTSLVVAPASVVHNWMNELRRFAPSLLACNYTGEASVRRDKRLALLRWDVVVTTYQTLRTDIEHLAPLQFGIVVFDESQAFKTHTSKVHQAVCRLTSLHRMALSGTPVENNLHELWSLMSVLNPCLLGSHRSFQQAFIAPIAGQMEQQRTELLQRLIAPYFLKRTKEEVLSDLPERQDEVVVCPMTDSQASRYAVELSKARNEWLEEQSAGHTSHTSNVKYLAIIQRLRQIANGEGKMQVVFERLESLRGTRHKVLLFSEYVTLLKHVGDEMQQRGWSYALLTGETQRREQVIDRFQGDASCQFFLISLKAGGLGLNLTAADYVFVLDPWWNVAAEEQAIARSHRIGQHRPVFVYRFVSENTLEQQILTLQERKQTLIDSVMPFICKY